jgi:hypothetical protein
MSRGVTSPRTCLTACDISFPRADSCHSPLLLPSLQLASGAVSGAKGRPTAQHAKVATAAEELGHANVLVAHLQEGIEAIHLYTGPASGDLRSY